MISLASSHKQVAHRGLHEFEQRLALDDEASNHDPLNVAAAGEICRHAGPAVDAANRFGRVVRHREQPGHKRIGERRRFDDGVQKIARRHVSSQRSVSDVAGLPAYRFGGRVVDLLSCRFLDSLQERVDRHGKARDEVQVLAAPNVARKSDDFTIDLRRPYAVDPSLGQTERILYSRASAHGLIPPGYENFIAGIDCSALWNSTSLNHRLRSFPPRLSRFCNSIALPCPRFDESVTSQNSNPGASRGERNGEKNDAILASDRPACSLRRWDVAHPRLEPGGGNPLADEPSRNDEARLPMFLGGAARLNRSAFWLPLRRGGRAAWEADTHDICSSVPPIVDRRRHKGRINGDAGLAPGRARNSFSCMVSRDRAGRRTPDLDIRPALPLASGDALCMARVGHSGIDAACKNIDGR